MEDELAEEDNSIPADPTVRNFSYTVLDDKIYFRENSRMAPVEVSATAENRIKGMIRIRDSVRKLIELQTEDYPDSEIKAEQERLNALYDTFSKQYGLINSRANISAFSQDSSFSLLSALEVLGDEGQLERKADIFYKRTIKPHTPVTSVDTSSEALAVSMGEKSPCGHGLYVRADRQDRGRNLCELEGRYLSEPDVRVRQFHAGKVPDGRRIPSPAMSVKSWYSPESQRSFTPKNTQSMWKHWNGCSPKT